MAFKRMINCVETHDGEPMRVVTGGVGHIPGDSVYEMMQNLRKTDDGLRKFLLREPRGYPPLCCNIVVPPKHPDAAAGFIIMEQVELPYDVWRKYNFCCYSSIRNRNYSNARTIY